MKIIECVNTVKVGDTIIFRKGELVDLDNLKKIPVDNGLFTINFDNPAYFRKYCQRYKIGTYLTYKNKKGTYFCRITDFYPSERKYRIQQVEGSFDEIVKVSDIVPTEPYYFINTEGVICLTYKGKNKKRDEWTHKCKNQFNSRKEAEEFISNI